MFLVNKVKLYNKLTINGVRKFRTTVQRGKSLVTRIFRSGIRLLSIILNSTLPSRELTEYNEQGFRWTINAKQNEHKRPSH